MCEYVLVKVIFFVSVQANEVLLAGAKLSATEAYERGLVTRVFPKAEFQEKLKETVQYIASLPPKVRVAKCIQRTNLMCAFILFSFLYQRTFPITPTPIHTVTTENQTAIEGSTAGAVGGSE